MGNEPIRNYSIMVALALALLTTLGLISVVMSAETITTTITTVETIPGTTYTTTIEVEGGTMGEVIVSYPNVTVVRIVNRPDQLCVIIVKSQEIPAGEYTVSMGGGTIAIPGTTFKTTITEQTILTTILETIGGETITTTGYRNVVLGTTTVVEFAGVTTTYVTEIPVFLYGEIIEWCDRVVVVNIERYVLETVPATVFVAFEGFTTSFPGFTTVVTLEGFSIPATTVTVTETSPGTTYTTTYVNPGTTYTTTVSIEGTTVVTTVSQPEQVVTRTKTITTVLEEGETTIIETPKTETVVEEEEQTGVELAPKPTPPIDILTIAIISVIAITVVVLVVGIMLMRR